MAIKSKALFMLVVFAANFYTVCHCAPLSCSPAHPTDFRSSASLMTNCPSPATPVTAPHQSDCCRGHHPSSNPTSTHPQAYYPGDTKPCNNKDGCCQTHSIKFNLLEKQTAPPITTHAVPVITLPPYFIRPVTALASVLELPSSAPKERYRKKAPPDRQSLYQLFLI